MTLAKLAEKLDDFDLEEGVLDTANFVLRRVATHQKTLQLAAKWLHKASEPRQMAVVDADDLTAERHSSQQHRLVLVLDALSDSLLEVLDHVRDVFDRADGSQASSCSNVRRARSHESDDLSVQLAAHLLGRALGDGSQAKC